ncbi:MAG: type VI secretion system contractile sheath large subunit [Pseudomonadota bacterium]
MIDSSQMTDNTQQKISSSSLPRVRIAFDIQNGGVTEKKELPFILGIFADLKGDRQDAAEDESYTTRSMIDIDRDSFNDVMYSFAPRVDLREVINENSTLKELLTDPQDDQLVFSNIDAFTPTKIIQALPSLTRLYLMRSQIRQLQIKAESHSDISAALNEAVGLIDQKLSRGLSAIMHCASFKKMESTWRGLHFLVMNTETNSMLKLKVFNATKEELRNDLLTAVAIAESHLFKLIYEAEYGTYGGQPFSLLVGDYAINNSREDMDFLGKIAEVAAANHAPFIAQASLALLQSSGLDKLHDLKKPGEASHATAWQTFRELEDSRYITLVAPRVLLRLPYGTPNQRNTLACVGFNFEEQVTAVENNIHLHEQSAEEQGSALRYADPLQEHFLWGNPVYHLAERITRAFSLHSWTAAIRDSEGGGLVEDLPAYTYLSSSGKTELFCPTETTLVDELEKELTQLGFVFLSYCKDTHNAVFYSEQVANLPKKNANVNAILSVSLPYMLAASRFAHYLKAIVHTKVGSFLTRGNVEFYLNTWIANYVLLDDGASQDIKACYPLRQANVIVTEVPGAPGSYRATLFLKPHFQLEELTASMRLFVNLPK